jgi:hypothetical protein
MLDGYAQANSMPRASFLPSGVAIRWEVDFGGKDGGKVGKFCRPGR